MSEKVTDRCGWLTPEQLLKEFSIKLALQAKLRSERKIPYSKLGTKHIFYSRDKINSWLEAKSIDEIKE